LHSRDEYQEIKLNTKSGTEQIWSFREKSYFTPGIFQWHTLSCLYDAKLLLTQKLTDRFVMNGVCIVYLIFLLKW